MSQFVENAKKGIKKHPEIFSALMEFEITKKIPKFRRRKRIDITLDEQILNEIKKYCSINGISTSRFIEKLIKEKLIKNNN